MNRASDSASPAVTREWRRVSSDLPVIFVWAYDTAAILDDYYDSEPGTLPAGQLILFSAVAEDPAHYLCDLDDPSFVENAALPAGRVMRFRPWCSATRLQAVLQVEHYHTQTAATERPSWLKRLIRRMTR